MFAKLALATAVLASSVWAQAQTTLPKTHLRVVGSISSLTQYKDYEIPFWTKQLAKRSSALLPKRHLSMPQKYREEPKTALV